MFPRVTRLLRQLDFYFTSPRAPTALVDSAELQETASDLFRSLGCHPLSDRVRVEWNKQLRTCAGRADTKRLLVSLNPRLADHGDDEIDRTLRHELAHLLAQFRAGRRRIPPHGALWRKACKDLGIPGEARCHSLPFEIRRPLRRYNYKCPKCARDFPRVRKHRSAVACLACCRQYARGKFDRRYRLRLAA
jgi:SprT protein